MNKLSQLGKQESKLADDGFRFLMEELRAIKKSMKESTGHNITTTTEQGVFVVTDDVTKTELQRIQSLSEP